MDNKKHDYGKAVACNGVPIFDGYGGVMSVEDADRIEASWERAENYAMDRESLDSQIAKANSGKAMQTKNHSMKFDELSR